MVATPANTAQPRRCEECGGRQIIKIRLIKTKDRRKWRFLVMGLITIPGTLFRAWVCESCGLPQDAGTKWVGVEQPEPVRPEIVSAIKRLKAAGHRFFDWEKK